jgi:hypothetical protein
MAAKATKKKSAKDAPKKDAPKKGAAATAPENRAHHATLSGTECSDCAVGLLRQLASESLRNQKKADPGNQRFHLQEDEELELLRTNPLTLQLVSLRRERSLSNRFDDLLVVLYNPALLKEEEKTVLEAEGLLAGNLKDAQAFVDAVLAEKEWAPAKHWPLPGVDVSCPKCMHWRVLAFPITTEPGYNKKKPSARDDEGNKLPDFDNHTLLPNDVGAVAPGIYNESYRVGLHKSSVNPPESYAALQLTRDSIPARRRYPLFDFLNAAQAAHDAGSDEALCATFAQESEEAKTQKEARARLEKELGEKLPRKNDAQRKSFARAVNAALLAENLERYKPRIAQQRKLQALEELDHWLNGYVNRKKEKVPPKINPSERFVRLEDASGAETQNFETEDNAVLSLAALEDDEAPMKAGLQLVLKPLPPPPSAPPPPTTPALLKTEAPPPPPPPRTVRLKANDVLVTFGTAGGTNIHRSVDGEEGSWRRNREVNNFSEGCQVFRSPQDFCHFLQMAMLSKRALCPSRKASCGAELTVEDVEKGIGALMTRFINKCPKDFADSAINDVETAFTPPPLPPPTQDTQAPTDAAPVPAVASPTAATPPAPEPNTVPPPPAPDPKLATEVEKLIGSVKAEDFDKQVLGVFLKVFSNPLYNSDGNFVLLKDYTRKQIFEALLSEDSVKKAAEGGAPQAPKEKKSFEKALEEALAKSLKGATQSGLEKLQTKLTEVKDEWVKKLYVEKIKERHQEYLKDRLEPCDFGACGFKFDYMLAETTRPNMEAFVAKLGDRDWSALFPEDAPPPPPRPAKKAPSKSASSNGKTPTAGAGTADR